MTTNSRAIDWLFWTWWGFSLLLLMTIGIGSLNGKYGDDSSIPIQWAVAIVAPCLALITAAWRNKGKGRWKTAPVATQQFVGAIIFSLIVWFGTVAIFVFAAVYGVTIFAIIPSTVAIYSFVQAAVIASVSSLVFASRD